MSKVEIIKHGNQVNIDRYEEEHNPKITFICNRCGCEWKCKYFDNTFGTPKDFNGDPDIICPECWSNDTKKKQKESIKCGDMDCAFWQSGICSTGYSGHKHNGICPEFVRG